MPARVFCCFKLHLLIEFTLYLIFRHHRKGGGWAKPKNSEAHLLNFVKLFNLIFFKVALLLGCARIAHNVQRLGEGGKCPIGVSRLNVTPTDAKPLVVRCFFSFFYVFFYYFLVSNSNLQRSNGNLRLSNSNLRCSSGNL